VRQVQGIQEDRARCPACAYSLRGHDGAGAVRCPECGRRSTPGEIEAAAARPPPFRWWLAPAFAVPGAIAVLLAHLSLIAQPDGVLVRAALFAALYPIAFLAVRDHPGPQRGGAAFALTVFLWLTSSLAGVACEALAA
jgi:hypothetical protein